MALSFQKSCLSAILVSSLLSSNIAFTCTRVLYAPAGHPVMVGRNMDWFEDMKTNLYVFPKGMPRNGLDADNPLKWVSKYGSIVAMGYDIISTDGINEKGLSAQINGLQGSDFGARDKNLPGLSIVLWTQFYLDNFATVAEAVRYTETAPFQVLTFYEPKIHANINLHLSIEDATGDSAILEYIDGKLKIFHDKSYTVMTNEPFYNQQLENLKQYEDLGGEKPIPGTTLPSDRFVRAAYALKHLPEPKSRREQVGELFTVMNNVGQPYGIPTPERPHISYSIWRTVEDLTNRVYYFSLLTNLNKVYVELDRLNLNAGAPVLKLDIVNQPDLTGDVTTEFKPL